VREDDYFVDGVVEGFVVIGIVILVGYLLGRSGVLGPSAVDVLSRLAFFIASPALLFVTLAHADIRAVFSAGLVVTAVSSSLACLLYLPVGWLRHRPPGETAVGSMASGYVNAGNLGIPIATYALGSAASMAPVMLFQLTVLAPLFSTVLDLTAARAQGERPPLLRTLTAPLRNPIAIASAAGLLVSATGVAPPAAVLAPVELIGALAVPAMLLAFGLSLRGAERPGAGDGAPSLAAVMVLKNLVQPALALALGLALGLSGHALLAVVVCAALPTAQNVFGYAVRFGQGVTLSRDAGLATTVASVPVLVTVVALLA
jgi:malonate transporter and related proteins